MCGCTTVTFGAVSFATFAQSVSCWSVAMATTVGKGKSRRSVSVADRNTATVFSYLSYSSTVCHVPDDTVFSVR